MTASPFLTRRKSLLWLLLVGSETLAQLALKQAAIISDVDAGASTWLTTVVANPWFLLSILCDISGFSAWIAILRRHDLSLAVPLSSLSYVTTVAMTFILLHESVTLLQVAGMVCIGFGILVLTQNDDRD